MLYKHILNVYLWCGIQIHLAGDTSKAPKVLILQVASVAPTHNLHGDEVLTWLQIFGDIELSSYLRVLAVAYVLSVYPEAQITGCRAYIEVNLLTFPVGGQLECTAIRTCVVVCLADVWWVVLECGAPGITHVLIDFVAVTLYLKQSRHREVYPLRVIIL